MNRMTNAILRRAVAKSASTHMSSSILRATAAGFVEPNASVPGTTDPARTPQGNAGDGAGQEPLKPKINRMNTALHRAARRGTFPMNDGE